MSSKNWKSLLFASVIALSLTACGNDDTKTAPPSPYAGVWANKTALQVWRDNKNNPNQFCQYVYAWKAQKKIGGRYYNMSLNPYIIQTNMEVFLYSSQMSMSEAGYREAFLQGVVNGEGLFLIINNPTSFQALAERKFGPIEDRSKFTVDQNRTLMTVRKGDRKFTFWRTEPSEMSEYLEARHTCEDIYEENQGKPSNNNDRAEEGANNHDEAPEEAPTQENEWDLTLGS